MMIILLSQVLFNLFPLFSMCYWGDISSSGCCRQSEPLLCHFRTVCRLVSSPISLYPPLHPYLGHKHLVLCFWNVKRNLLKGEKRNPEELMLVSNIVGINWNVAQSWMNFEVPRIRTWVPNQNKPLHTSSNSSKTPSDFFVSWTIQLMCWVFPPRFTQAWALLFRIPQQLSCHCKLTTATVLFLPSCVKV